MPSPDDDAELARRLERAEAARAAADERLRAVIDHAPVALFAFDKHGQLTLGEGRALKPLRGKVIDKRNLFEIYGDVPAIVAHARRALRGETFTGTVEIPGIRRVFETRFSPMRDANGEVAEVICVATDVTERRHAEEALKRSEARLVEAAHLASLGTLAAGMAHEINNPLAYVALNLDGVVQALAELRASGASVPMVADMEARLLEARAGLERVRAIVLELKAVSRVDADLSSRVDGCTLRVVLPPGDADGARPSAPPSAPPQSRVARRGRVLVVDDEPVLAMALGRFLDPMFEVTICPGGKEALGRLLAGETFDVILCDLVMPDVTGMDLHETVLSKRPELAPRIVFMTGGAFSVRAREFAASMPNRMLDKPFDLNVLVALLRERVAAA